MTPDQFVDTALNWLVAAFVVGLFASFLLWPFLDVLSDIVDWFKGLFRR